MPEVGALLSSATTPHSIRNPRPVVGPLMTHQAGTHTRHAHTRQAPGRHNHRQEQAHRHTGTG